jgi:hypothetical protein
MMPDSTRLTLTQTRIAEGVWEGLLTGVDGAPPTLEARHQDRVLDGLTVTPVPGATGRFAVRLPIPSAVLGEGVQTVLLLAGGQVLLHFTLVVGVPLEDDLRAEISLLRAELDLLKRAFRRHCAETAG